MTDSEILQEIKEARGITIYYGRSIEGNDYWTCAGGLVNAGGYLTLDEAVLKWAEVQKRAKNEL